MQHNVSLKRNEIYHINLSIKIGKTLKTPKIVNFDQGVKKRIFFAENIHYLPYPYLLFLC